MSTNMNSGDEEPPSLVQCRVCGSMIDINNKKEQHVVKCEYCNEATVSASIVILLLHNPYKSKFKQSNNLFYPKFH